MEGCMMGIPSLAVSLADVGRGNYETAARFTRALVKVLLERPVPKDICYNVNVPDRPFGRMRGVSVTHLGKRIYGKDLESGIDPRGQAYYWLAGETPTGIAVPGSDIAAIQQGKISVTPLRLDMTATEMIPVLRQWSWRY